MDELVQWLRAQLDHDEQVAFAAADTLGDRVLLHWRAVGSGVEVDGMRSLGELPVVTNRFMEGMAGYEVERARALHIESHDPDRVMGEVAAKRQIIDLHKLEYRERTERVIGEADDPFCTECFGEGFPCATLRLLALPYADRPGYRDEWRP